MSNTVFTRPVEAGAAISWMIYASKGAADSGEYFSPEAVKNCRALFNSAYADHGHALVRDLKSRIREGERSDFEMSSVAPNQNWYYLGDAKHTDGPANPTVFNRPVEAGSTTSWMMYGAKAGDDWMDSDEQSRIRYFFNQAYSEFGQAYIQDLQDRVNEGEMDRADLQRLAPEFFWY